MPCRWRKTLEPIFISVLAAGTGSTGYLISSPALACTLSLRCDAPIHLNTRNRQQWMICLSAAYQDADVLDDSLLDILNPIECDQDTTSLAKTHPVIDKNPQQLSSEASPSLSLSTLSKRSVTLDERSRRLLLGSTSIIRPITTPAAKLDSFLQLQPSDNQQRQQQHWTPEEYFKEAQNLVNAWSYRHSHKAASMVEKLIRRIIQVEEGMQEADSNAPPPDIDRASMYTCAIRAWANTRERNSAQRAEEILDTMQQCFAESGLADIKPGIEAFNLVLLAYSRSGLRDAPQQALRVLAKLHDWYTTGATDVAPNRKSYAAVLRAFGNTGKPDTPRRVKGMLEHMEQLAQDYPSVRPDSMCHGAYFSALLNAMERDYITGEEAVNTAEAYLYDLMSSPYEDAHPDAWTFNILLAIWSKAYTEDTVERVDALMEAFEDYHEKAGRSEKTRPSTLSYNFLLATYSRSTCVDKGERATLVLRRMQALVESGNNTAVRPDAITYNTVMSAYGKSRHENAPYYVEDLLREMHREYEKTKDPELRPTCRSYNNCVNAWAQSSLPGSAARIMDWIVHMQKNAEREGKRCFGPNKWTFNSFLQALSKSGESTMGEEAKEVLNQMMEYYEKGWVDLKPDVMTFTAVIHCIAVSGTPDALERSLSIVRRMEDFHELGFGDVRPNAFTYNCVINAAAKSYRPGKAHIALQILRRMQEVALRPPTVTYNNVLNACAFANHRDDDPEEVLEIAHQVFEEAKAKSQPNFITFDAYVRVVGRCVRDGKKKKDLLQNVFCQCCEAGQLTNSVMKQLKYALTPRQYEDLRAEAISDERTGDFHSQYTKNAKLAKKSFQRTSVESGRA